MVIPGVILRSEPQRTGDFPDIVKKVGFSLNAVVAAAGKANGIVGFKNALFKQGNQPLSAVPTDKDCAVFNVVFRSGKLTAKAKAFIEYGLTERKRAAVNDAFVLLWKTAAF